MATNMKQSKLISTGIIVFVLLIVVVVFSNATFLTIEASERGVLFRRFSGGLDFPKKLFGLWVAVVVKILHVDDVKAALG